MLKVENYERKGEKASVAAETLSKIKHLIADLRSNDGAVRREARQALVFIGKPAVGLLIPLLKDPDDDVRWEVVKALAEIADPRAASDLVGLLMDYNFGVRWLAAEALIPMGRDALTPLLEELTEHSESSWLRSGTLPQPGEKSSGPERSGGPSNNGPGGVRTRDRVLRASLRCPG